MAVFLACTVAACGGISSPSKDNHDEPFSGTLDPLTARSHSFTVSKNGEFSIRVTALAPLTNVLIGVTVGQDTSSGCAYSSFPSLMTVNSAPYTGPINKGSYCVVVSDPGSLTGPESYTVVVSHP
jgi:hypothetical protein